MSRLFDRVLRYGFTWTEIDDITQRDYNRMQEGCPVLVTNNVTEYFFAQTEKATYEYDTDIPNMAPPFSRCFVETRKPTGVLLPSGFHSWESYGVQPQAWGLFLQADDMKAVYGDDYPERSLENMRYSCATMRDQNGDLYFKGQPQGGARWMIHASFFYELPGGKPQGPAFLQFMYVSEEGKSVLTSEGEQMIWGMVPSLDSELQRFIANATGPMLLPLWFAISLLHCKNVSLDEHEPPQKPSRKHERKHGLPLTKYYTLEIDPMTAVLEREGKVSQNGLKKALHICRGHFATYSDDKPLFGKYAGTFWKPQHVKGSKKSGEVVKDYAVKAPKGTP